MLLRCRGLGVIEDGGVWGATRSAKKGAAHEGELPVGISRQVSPNG